MSIQPYQQQQNNGQMATYQQPSNQPALPNKTLTALTEWAQAAQAAYEVATNLVQTSFVPEAFRGKAHEATAAILAGDEVGLSPMAALRAFDVIQGTAAPRAITQRAIIQSRGHEVWKVESSSTRAIVHGKRAGSNVIQESIWTIDRARALNLTGKPNWKNQPEAMLIARATSECCRLVASDALLGLPYSTEELADGEGWDQIGAGPAYEPAPAAAPGQVAEQAAEPKKRTAKRATPPRKRTEPAPAPAPEPAASTAPEPPLPGEDGYDEPAPEQPDKNAPVTRKQLGLIMALFTEVQWTDRADRLRASSTIVGRPLTSANDLTIGEASTLINTLNLVKGQDDPPTALGELLDGIQDKPADAEFVDGDE